MLWVRSIFYLLGFLYSISSLAQKEANHWYFGYKSGLYFSSGSPIVDNNTNMHSWEGCSVISDSEGNLLFYTDGDTVWDRNNQFMPNGTGLLGGVSSSQAALIVPQPKSDSLYYIFTTDHAGQPNGLRYSVVDISLNGGYGDVIAATKNTLLLTPVTEQVAATKHANGCDFWIATHEYLTDSFYIYLLTETGLSAPQIIEIGQRHSTGFHFGQLVFSPDGSKMATPVGLDIGLFDFDNSTGMISNPMLISQAPSGAFGLAFSLDKSRLYASTITQSKLFQYDLTLGSQSLIEQSIDTLVNADMKQRSLQLAPDGKIYVANQSSLYLSVINNPNELGSACNFVDSAIYLDSKVCGFGLPNFPSNYFNPVVPDYEMDFDTVCFGSEAVFTGVSPDSIQTWAWHFGDNDAGNDSIATGKNVTHHFTDTGYYDVQLVINTSCKTDTITKSVYVRSNDISLDIGMDTMICPGNSLTLEAGNNDTWQWSTNETTQTITVTDSAIYFVSVTKANCKKSDTITVGLHPEVIINLTDTVMKCRESLYSLDANNSGSSYAWSTADTTQILNVDTSGLYSVTVTNYNGCVSSDSTMIIEYPIPAPNLGLDTIICGNTSITISPGIYNSYSWSTTEVTSSIIVSDSALYSVTVTDSNNCLGVDSILIDIEPVLISVDLGNNEVLCFEEYYTLDAGNSGNTFNWSTTDTTQVINSNDIGIVSVTITDTFGCKESGSILISNRPSLNPFLGNDTTICSKTSITITPGNYSEYLWSTNVNTQSISVSDSGFYAVTVTDINGCSEVDSILINVDECSIIDTIFFDGIIKLYPNPFSENTTILLRLESEEYVEMTIWDARGRLIKILESENLPKGDYTYQWSNTGGSVGMYLIYVIIGDKTEIIKVNHIK